MTLLEVDDLAVAFGRGPDAPRALDGVSFTVDAGERVALVGESGSGKTVTALAIMGLVDRPGAIVGGSIRLDGAELVGLGERDYRTLRGRDVAMVFQDPSRALNPVLRVGDQVAEAVTVHDPTADAAARAAELLERVGLTGRDARARDYPHQLSGGMRQRVMLAMALANRPRLLLADEPTTALDATTQAQVLALLDELRSDTGLAVLFVTHDLGVVAGVADRVVVLYAGRVVESAPTDALFAAPRHPYTRGLLASSPRLSGARGPARGSLPAIPGQPPALGAVPPGCAFHPRCAYAEQRCAIDVPGPEVLAEGRTVACLRARDLPDVEVAAP
ncbi:MAG: ABC transporter ATP-binding protein [Acidimicrobiia bacterium]